VAAPVHDDTIRQRITGLTELHSGLPPAAVCRHRSLTTDLRQPTLARGPAFEAKHEESG